MSHNVSKNIRQKLKFWSKIEILVKNRNFGQKSKFWSKIEVKLKCPKTNEAGHGSKTMTITQFENQKEPEKINITARDKNDSEKESNRSFSIFWYPAEAAQMATNDPSKIASFCESISHRVSGSNSY